MELTPEQQAEYAARSKEYSRRMMREHHVWQSDLVTKLRLKKVRILPRPRASRDCLLPEARPSLTRLLLRLCDSRRTGARSAYKQTAKRS